MYNQTEAIMDKVEHRNFFYKQKLPQNIYDSSAWIAKEIKQYLMEVISYYSPQNMTNLF